MLEGSNESGSGNPLVSVAIPAYNHERYVQSAIDSVMEQSYDNIEVTVLNDGSTDKTAAKIEESCRQYPNRLKSIKQKNQGLVRTLNRGIDLATGEYWCELASDDLMDRRNIELKVDFLEKNPHIDAVCSDSWALHPDETRTRMVPEKARPNPLVLESREDIFHVKIFFPSFLFRKSVFQRIGCFDESMRYYEDIEMKVRLLLFCKLGYIDEPLLFWRSHGANTSGQAIPRKRERMVAYEKIFSQPEMQAEWLLKRKMLGHAYYKYARALIQNNEKDKQHSVNWYLLRSLSLQPLRPQALYYLAKALIQGLFSF